MSKIDDLIAELCPEGVEFRELGELLGKVVGSNKKIVKSDIKSEGKYPVYTQGANQMPDGYSDDENNVVDDVPVILYGDHTNSLKWIDHEFIAGADGVKMIKTDLKYDISDKFLFHCMREQINLIPNDYARHFSKVRNLKIPLPPLAVQREIVDILDKFTQLEAELEAELEARKKQYEHYRNQLLTFDDNAGGVRWATLGEAGKLVRGNGLQKKDFIEEGYPCIHYGQIYTYYGTFTDKTKSFVSHELAEKLKKAQTGDVIITNTSENIEDVGKSVVWCGSGEIVTGGHATIFKPKLVSGKYFAYYTQTSAFYSEKRKYAKGTKVIDVSATDMAKIKIPIPPLAEQNRIVAILDKFDALTTDLSAGLPAELTARRQQYEHYRNKLLTFEERKEVANA